MRQADVQAPFRLLAIHRLGKSLLSQSPESADFQEGLAKVLLNGNASEEEGKIAFLYLLLGSAKLTQSSRHAIIEYASDVRHADVVAQKESAHSILRRSMMAILREMEEARAKRTD